MMGSRFACAGVLVAMLGAGAAGVLAGAGEAPAKAVAVLGAAFKVDPVHSSVIFRVKHMRTSYLYGRFNKVEGTFVLDEANPGASAISLEVATDSIDTHNAAREKHLKSPDFFSVSEHPKITFVSKKIESAGQENGEAAFNVTGDLTILGTTKEITAKVRKTGQGKGPQGGEIAGLETMFTIKRSDFGMKAFIDNGGASDEVNLTVALEGGR